jgi:carboxypeptidase family protein/flagellar hook capping protein FlgD
MKRIKFIFFIISLFVNIYAEREIDATISCNTLYITGAENYLELEMNINSPDAEWLAYLQFTFPEGITPNDDQINIEGNYYMLQFNYSDENSITWGAGFGDTSLGFLTDGQYIFDIHLDIDDSVTGPIIIEFEGAGDDWGGPPHEFEGTFTVEPTLDNDLVALGLSGNTTPSEGTESIYDVHVHNQGNFDQPGAAYSVMLYDADDELIGSAPGIYLEAGDAGVVQIPWIPYLTGATYIYGYIDFANDENLTNNTSDNFDVNVQSMGTIVISIGQATTLSYLIPANFYYQSSLSECWYYPEEIDHGGLITQLGYFTNWSTSLENTPMKIWMGETEQPQAAIGWVPAGDLQLVFDGEIDFSPGENDLLIPLDNFFPYSGADNLVIMMERPMDTQYYSSSDTWYITEDVYHPARSIHYFSDWEAADPFAPPEGNVISAFPDIGLYFDDTPTGSLDGYVYGNDRDPLAGALVQIEGTTFSTLTDQNGYYDFPYVFIDTYDITASYFGYYNGTETATIIENELTTQDIYLDHLPTVNVTGHVVTSDTGADVTGAEVMLEGYDNYYGIMTDDSGDFLIPGVYASHTYAITINYTGYETYINNSVVVGDTDLDLGEIIVNEIALPVYDVIAEEDHDGNALIVWQSPAEDLNWYVIDHNAMTDASSNNRLLETFNLHRLLEVDQGNHDNWIEIVSGLTETSYVDTSWPDVEPGTYLYAVTAVYTNGVESEPAFSQTMIFEAFVAVTINLSTDSGDDPGGALTILTNQDGAPEHIYTLMAAQGGVAFFPQVYYGIYDLEITLEDHSDYSQSNISIMDNITIPVVLNELILPPVNLIVEDTEEGVYLSWSPPGSDRNTVSKTTGRHLLNYNIYVDGILEGTSTDLFYLVIGYPAGTYEFGVSAYYSSENESEIITVEATVDADENSVPNVTKLFGNYPNPFNPTTTISFSLTSEDAENATLEIYNLKGSLIKQFPLSQDHSSFDWDGTDTTGQPVPSGIYFYKLKAGKYSAVNKMILLK